MIGLILSALFFQSIEGISTEGGRTSPDGTEEIQVDLPGEQQLKNVGGKDGAGLCVFTSIEHSGRWQNVDSVLGFQKKMTLEAGGGYPSKTEKMMEKYCADAQYLQYEGNDPALIKLSLATGRMPAVTYGYSPRYGRAKIAHMVNIVHLSQKWAAILDNNFPGENKYEWMSPEEFKNRWISGGGGWAVFLLAPPPPPAPANQVSYAARPPAKVWGTLACSSVDDAKGYEWIRHADKTSDQIALYRNGVQVGTWKKSVSVYLELLPNGNWGAPVDNAPFPVPLDFRPEVVGQDFPFGVDRSQMDSTVEKYWLDGKPCTRQKAYEAMEAGSQNLTDDRAKFRITVIGTVEECDKVRNDLKTDLVLSVFAPDLLLQCYRPTDWAVTGIGYAIGHPRVIVQQTSGEVLHSQAEYIGADDLASALRRIKPNYDPKKDPDARKIPLIDGGLVQIASMLRAGLISAVVFFALGFITARFGPSIRGKLSAARARMFPPKPTMEDLIVAALTKIKEQENNVRSNNPHAD